MTVELVFYAGSTLLESPCWSPLERVIYCVSIEQGMIYRVDYVKGNVQSIATDGVVGCVAINEDGFLISAEKSGIHRYKLKEGKKDFLVQLEKNPEMRYNDGKLDPKGRFLVGTKGDKEEMPGHGKLYSYDGEKLMILIENLTIPNGIGFSAAGDKLYFIDTTTKKVGCYDYDLITGKAVFEKYIIEIEGPGWPDGICVDNEGMIWIAEWEGGKVCRWNPETGEKIREIKIPCNRVTSCCIGGDNGEYLFVTTAKGNENNEIVSGGLFRCKIK